MERTNDAAAVWVHPSAYDDHRIQRAARQLGMEYETLLVRMLQMFGSEIANGASTPAGTLRLAKERVAEWVNIREPPERIAAALCHRHVALARTVDGALVLDLRDLFTLENPDLISSSSCS